MANRNCGSTSGTRLCQRIIVMANGGILTEGSADEVRKDARVLEAFLGGE